MMTISACTGEEKVKDYEESDDEKVHGIAEKGKGEMQQLGGHEEGKWQLFLYKEHFWIWKVGVVQLQNIRNRLYL